jgi:hypothetical protein
VRSDYHSLIAPRNSSAEARLLRVRKDVSFFCHIGMTTSNMEVVPHQLVQELEKKIQMFVRTIHRPFTSFYFFYITVTRARIFQCVPVQYVNAKDAFTQDAQP